MQEYCLMISLLFKFDNSIFHQSRRLQKDVVLNTLSAECTDCQLISNAKVQYQYIISQLIVKNNHILLASFTCPKTKTLFGLSIALFLAGTAAQEVTVSLVLSVCSPLISKPQKKLKGD